MILSEHVDVFIQAEGRYDRGGSPIDLIVMHDMEAPETATMAEDLGRNWFAKPRDANGKRVYASTQLGVDNNSVVGYVYEDQAAYGANRPANLRGIHIELAGYARQSKDEWLDAFGRAMLDRAARVTAEICRRRGIPVVWLDAAALRSGHKGITSHDECSKAWGGNHTDPGPNFPVAVFMALVQRYYDDPKARPVLVPGDRDGHNSLGASAGRVGKLDGACSDLQRLLVDDGYDLGEFGPNGDGVDGDPGGLTWDAVRAARLFRGLSDEEIVDEALWLSLDGQGASPVREPVVVPDPPVVVPEPAVPAGCVDEDGFLVAGEYRLRSWRGWKVGTAGGQDVLTVN